MSFVPSADFKGLPDETIPVILPAPAHTFEKRSARLRFLAPGHPIGAYLEAIARLADAQLTASQAPSEQAPTAIPLNVRDPSHGKGWQKALEVIVSEMQLVPLPEPSHAALSRLRTSPPADLEFSALEILGGNRDTTDLAASPFIAAALQVYWTGLASKALPGPPKAPVGNCPVCGSPPVAGMVLSGRKLRYLCCSLCSTHWYVPRVTCTNCGSTAGLSYFAVRDEGTKAESCSSCGTYLKLFYLESNPEAEALADDLATLPLDLLMSDEAYSRSGVNLVLLPGPPG